MSRRDFFQLFCMFYLWLINRKWPKEKKHQYLSLYQNWNRTPVYFELAVSASYISNKTTYFIVLILIENLFSATSEANVYLDKKDHGLTQKIAKNFKSIWKHLPTKVRNLLMVEFVCDPLPRNLVLATQFLAIFHREPPNSRSVLPVSQIFCFLFFYSDDPEFGWNLTPSRRAVMKARWRACNLVPKILQ